MKRHNITLALQGGGAHGAFTWGVLDRLLEEENIEIEGVSGTSAGAVNAALLVSGLIKGGCSEARKNLECFWKDIFCYKQNLPLFDSYSFFPFFNFPIFQNIQGIFIEYLSQIFSPYQIDFFNDRLFKDVFHKIINFDLIQKNTEKKIYVSATNVETNQIKVFENKDICVESLLASMSLPTIHQAVQWGENFFWDGGYMGNPILEPLIYNCGSKDLFVIQVNPIQRKGIPKTVREILDRLNEITFNASLMREIRGIVNIHKLSEFNACTENNPYRDLRLHSIADEAFMATLGASSKLSTDLFFVLSLKEKGRTACANWLKGNKEKIGIETTMDLSNWRLEMPKTSCLEWKTT